MSKPDFCRTYGIEVPVVLAGMAMISEPRLVAAVSDAGGLGVLGTGPMPPSILHEKIAAVRALTSRPFGVNQIVEQIALGPLTTREGMDVIAAERVPLVVFFWNPPPAEWLAVLRSAGTKIWMTVTSFPEFETALDLGVDAVMVQGLEAGGHNRSAAGLFALLPAIARAAGERHVIAAGGIADGATAAAAFALGADAICMGTRFVACAESPAHPEWQRRIVASGADATVITRIFGPEWPDAPMRVLRNTAVDRSLQNPAGLRPPGAAGTTTLYGQVYEMPRCSAILPTQATDGDLDEMCLAAGTSAALIDDIKPAATIVREVWEGARARLSGLLQDHG